MGQLTTQSAAAAAAMGVGDTNIPDETTHDYAACQDLSCVRCDAYGDGYTAGKEKAFFEVRTWHPKEHAPTCGCNPCITARSVIEKARGTDLL